MSTPKDIQIAIGIDQHCAVFKSDGPGKSPTLLLACNLAGQGVLFFQDMPALANANA